MAVLRKEQLRKEQNLTPAFSPGSRGRLTGRDLARFPGDNLFDRLARAVCQAECLPRKELYEAWEVARRVRRLFRGGRVVDLGAGHGLLAHLMLLLDDSSPQAIAVDRRLPPSSITLHEALAATWPRLRGRITFHTGPLDEFVLHAGDVVVSSHACGALTDVVLDRAGAARARVAVLPCCHHLARGRLANGPSGDGGAASLEGWLDGALAIDVARAQRLQALGYRIRTQTIAPGITPKARLLVGAPIG